MTPAVRLLGPFAVHADGRPVDLGPARQRALLAVLLLGAGRPFSADELAVRLWGADPPTGCRESLRAYVCRLRRALAPTGLVLDRRCGGYVADADPDDVDLVRFRRHVTVARTAQASADHHGAFAAYDLALELWTGDALGGVGSPWLDTRRDALALERHAVLLDHVDAALAVGEHARIVASLTERADAEPYDERLAGQLVLALHQSGRTGQALAHYRHVHRRLREDLGSEPGAVLRALHQSILAGATPSTPPTSSATAAPPTAPAPPAALGRVGAAAPHQLPPAPAGFVDRVAERAALDAALASSTGGPIVAVLSGPGGVGKTALAVQWACARSEGFPDGRLFIDLRGFDPHREPLPTETALRALVLALGADAAAMPVDLDALVGLYRSLTGRRRLLVVADNARSAEHVRPLVPSGVGSVLVVTSRSRLTGLVSSHAATPVPVATMSGSGARRLLASRLGSRRMSEDPAAVDALVAHCAGLPLALAIVAARAVVSPHLPLATFAAELHDEDARLDALSAGEARTDLRATVAVSVGVLPTPAAEAFALLGLLPGRTFDIEELAALGAVRTGVACTAVRDLVAHHLAEDAGGGRFRMHDLVRLYAVGLAQALPEGGAARRRLLELHRDAGPAQGARLPVVFASVAAAVEAGLDELACDLAGCLVDPLGGRACWPELVQVAAAARDAATRLGDRARLAASLLALGRGLIGTEDYESADAALAQARALADALNDSGLRAEAHRASARWAARQGRHDEALRHDRLGLLLHRRVGDRLGEAVALNAIGWHEAHLGRPTMALCRSRDALEILADLDAATDTAATLDTVAYSLDLLGRYQEAQDHYCRSAAQFLHLGHFVIGASVLERLATSYDRSGDPVRARAARAEAATALRSTGLLGWDGADSAAAASSG